ncbi:MAG TPA: phosphodiester glycosidase family protein [Labilithrix sp.]|nr:phosphodiester glycosidase family protein [Labilithrix sp.]
MAARTERHLFAAACVLAVSCFAGPASAADTWTDPFPGVRHLHRETSNQNIHVVRVDLCAAGVSFRATKPDEKGKQTSVFASSVGAQAAVNGDFFKSGFVLERGIGVGDGVAWPIGTPEDVSVGQLAFGDGRLELIPDFVLQNVEPWMKQVVGGRPTVLLDGKGTDTSGHPNLCQRHPRTAVGLTKDKKVLLIGVVDGRATTRIGMTCNELGDFMKELGAYNAMNFDGGGSSTMWIQGQGVLNNPTDGSERTVANHLAIFAKGQGAATACSSPPIGKIEASCSKGITGWVRDAAEPVEIDLTFDAKPGTTLAKVQTVEATQKRADTCNDAGVCGLGFQLSIPNELRDGKSHLAWATFKGRPADVLGGGPATFTCGEAQVPENDAGTYDAGSPARDDDHVDHVDHVERDAGTDSPSETSGVESCQTAPVRAGGLFARAALGLLVGVLLERMRRRSGR